LIRRIVDSVAQLLTQRPPQSVPRGQRHGNSLASYLTLAGLAGRWSTPIRSHEHPRAADACCQCVAPGRPDNVELFAARAVQRDSK